MVSCFMKTIREATRCGVARTGLFLLLCAALCEATWPAWAVGAETGKATPTRLVVDTHNIYFANTDLAGTAKMIRDTGADIVCLQETTARSEPFLRSSLGNEYPYMRFSLSKIHNGPGFLSKYPIRGYAYEESKAGMNGTAYALVDMKGTLVHVVNVHLNPIWIRTRGLGAAGDAVRELESVHGREMADIFKNLNPSSPTLIMGDFNSLSDQFATTFLKSHGFIDSFAPVHKYPDVFKTEHFKVRGVELGVRIDFIFHTDHFRTVESRVLRGGGSDHSLVTSVLELEAPNSAPGKPHLHRLTGHAGDADPAAETAPPAPHH